MMDDLKSLPAGAGRKRLAKPSRRVYIIANPNEEFAAARPTPIDTDNLKQKYQQRYNHSDRTLSSPSTPTSSPALESTPSPSTPGQKNIPSIDLAQGSDRDNCQNFASHTNSFVKKITDPFNHARRKSSGNNVPPAAGSSPIHHDRTSSPQTQKPQSCVGETRIFLTTDSGIFKVIDVTGARDAAFIRERVFADMQISDESQAHFSIYRTEVGSFAIGDALTDEHLFELCRDHGDSYASLKFMVSHTSAAVHEPPLDSSDKTRVFVTADSVIFKVVDVTGARDAAFIRERIFADMQISDESQAHFSIYRTEMGSFAIEDALTDEHLFELCRDHGDSYASLKFMVSHTSAAVHESPLDSSYSQKFYTIPPPVVPLSNTVYSPVLSQHPSGSRPRSSSSASERMPQYSGGGYDVSVLDDSADAAKRDPNRATMRPGSYRTTQRTIPPSLRPQSPPSTAERGHTETAPLRIERRDLPSHPPQVPSPGNPIFPFVPTRHPPQIGSSGAALERERMLENSETKFELADQQWRAQQQGAEEREKQRTREREAQRRPQLKGRGTGGSEHWTVIPSDIPYNDYKKERPTVHDGPRSPPSRRGQGSSEYSSRNTPGEGRSSRRMVGTPVPSNWAPRWVAPGEKTEPNKYQTLRKMRAPPPLPMTRPATSGTTQEFTDPNDTNPVPRSYDPRGPLISPASSTTRPLPVAEHSETSSTSLTSSLVLTSPSNEPFPRPRSAMGNTGTSPQKSTRIQSPTNQAEANNNQIRPPPSTLSPHAYRYNYETGLGITIPKSVLPAASSDSRATETGYGGIGNSVLREPPSPATPPSPRYSASSGDKDFGPLVETYKRLGDTFPERDLDKPVIEARSGGTLPASAKAIEPFPTPDRRERRWGIRWVANEEKPELDLASWITSVNDANMLRRRSTTLRESKVGEVTAEQVKNAASVLLTPEPLRDFFPEHDLVDEGERIPHSAPVDPRDTSTTSVSESAVLRLIRRAFAPHELFTLVEAIFSSSDESDMVRLLPKEDAQVFIDVIDEIMDKPDLAQRARKKCLKLLYKTCGNHALLPSTLKIPICYDRTGTALYRGGFADVWKGEHCGRDVAVKVVRTYSNSDLRKIIGSFCKEVVTWKTLRHPNVLPLIGVTMSETHFAMVSDWMVNGNINDFVKARPDANRLDLLGGVARGLIYIHGQGMVHGDLKGANIVIDQACCARLADFGLLTIISDPRNILPSSSYMEGGTARWMSPELIAPQQFKLKKSRPTKQSDCYALGMVIYETVSGRLPFHRDKDTAVLMNIVAGQRPPRGTGFADDLWKMLELCWMHEPNHRPSIEDVLQCLEATPNLLEQSPTKVDEEMEGHDDWDSTDSSPSAGADYDTGPSSDDQGI